MEKETLFIPPYLQLLGYATLPELRELSNRAVTVTTDAITEDPIWSPWRGILEYVCCVEFARDALKNLSSGRAIGSIDVVPAQYHSASLVFFAQATLDNVAVWTSKRLNFSVHGSDCCFHKLKFNQALLALVPNVAATVQGSNAFITKLENYRQEWIHRLTGGARIFSDKSPSDTDAQFQIMVPINPSIGHRKHDPNAYLKGIARTRTNNGGRWLYPVDHFADELTAGLKVFLLGYLAAVLTESRFSAK